MCVLVLCDCLLAYVFVSVFGCVWLFDSLVVSLFLSSCVSVRGYFFGCFGVRFLVCFVVCSVVRLFVSVFVSFFVSSVVYLLVPCVTGRWSHFDGTLRRRASGCEESWKVQFSEGWRGEGKGGGGRGGGGA